MSLGVHFPRPGPRVPLGSPQTAQGGASGRRELMDSFSCDEDRIGRFITHGPFPGKPATSRALLPETGGILSTAGDPRTGGVLVVVSTLTMLEAAAAWGLSTFRT